jgi:hypothetical protein
MSTAALRFRAALAADAAAIAELHAASWRSAYRGSLSDAYLDTDVAAERAAVWQRRLMQPSERQYVLLAEQNGELVGFACVLLDEEPTWGACLDNLHVRPGIILQRRFMAAHSGGPVGASDGTDTRDGSPPASSAAPPAPRPHHS